MRTFVPATLLSCALALASFGCSKLTEPAKEEPIQGQATTTAAETAEKPAPAPAPAPPPPPAPAPDADMKLEMKDTVVGKGAEAKKGDTVRVHYRGTLAKDGSEFDASKNHPPQPGTPEGFIFPLGGGRVIKGWDEGVPGMKVGGKRKLTIPSAMGYGARGAGEKIPPNSTLVFEVELLEIMKK